MPRFRFTLQTVLEARRRAERACQRQVAQLDRERLALEARLREQQAHLAASRRALRDRLAGTLHAQDLRMLAAAAGQQMRTAQRMMPELAALHTQLEAARARLVEAARHRRVLERLRERRRHEWLIRRERAETNALDELAVMRAAAGTSRTTLPEASR